MSYPSQSQHSETFKVIIVGDGGVGKSTFLRKIATAQYKQQYDPTHGVEIHPLDFSTSAGDVTFFCWDTAGQEKFGKLRDDYYQAADAAIIMFDVSSRNTFKSVPVWLRDITRVCGDEIPLIVVGNKVDVPERQIKPNNLKWPKELTARGFTYMEMSVKTGANITQPFGELLKELVGEDAAFLGDLSQEPAPATSPAVTPTTSQAKKDPKSARKERAAKAASTPLPDESTS